MTIQEIKKDLYRQKPVARLRSIKRDGIYYEAEIENGAQPIVFLVPFSEIEDAEFLYEMQSQLLIRYIVSG